jgi:hypothetical protein
MVVEQRVSRLDLLWPPELVQCPLDAQIERSQEDRDAGRVGHHVQAVIEERHPEVVELIDDREHRGALEHPVHLLHRRLQAAPDHAERDRVQVARGGRAHEPCHSHLKSSRSDSLVITVG